MCEGIERHRAHGKGACGHPTVHDVYARCCCESGSLSVTEEEIEVLEVYRKDLERELGRVKEKIAELKTRT